MKKLLLTTTAAMLLASCAVGPDFKEPAAPEVKSLVEGAFPQQTVSADNKSGAAQKFMQGKPVQADWWKLFGSEPLNQLMEQALQNNPDLKAARASLTQAQEQYYASLGAFVPAIDASYSPIRQRASSATTAQDGVFNLHNASVNVSYTVDLFGATRRGVEGLDAQVEAQRFEMEAAYLALTANVATAAIQEASLREQIEETKDIIAIQREQMNLIEKQFNFGAIPKTALLEQQALVAQTETTLPPLEKQLAQQRNLLAVLAGSFPGDGLSHTFDLTSLKLPEELPVSLPSDLVEQRPDIRAWQALMQAANAEVGIATAAMLPRITLSGGYGGSSTSFNNVFTPDTLVWSLGANILQPLFRGGELLHTKRAKVAAYERAEAQYRGTVLNAFRNVADVLRALQYDADALASQVRAERAAADSFALTDSQYKAGAIAYTELLDTQRAWQQARIGLVQAQAARYADTVALFQALGGGWWNRGAGELTPQPAAQPQAAVQAAPAAQEGVQPAAPIEPAAEKPALPAVTEAVTPITLIRPTAPEKPEQ